eukprot:m.22275 g.22275  ORF g.22275 m.22275 type:complete len:1587 (-) comp5444_c0_seq1:124-4884(-)
MEDYILYHDISNGETTAVFKGRKSKTLEYLALLQVQEKNRHEAAVRFASANCVQSPFVCESYLHCDTGPEVWLVSELCSGVTLANAVFSDGGFKDMNLLERVACEIALSVGHCHDASILVVDCRLKKYLLQANSIKLCSLARSLAIKRLTPVPTVVSPLGVSIVTVPFLDEEEVKRTRHTFKRLGIAHYLPPETLKHNKYDTASDFWSLGTSLFELLTARTLNKADVASQENTMQALKPFQETHPKFVHVLMNLLQHDPLKRYNWSDLLVQCDLFAGIASIDPEFAHKYTSTNTTLSNLATTLEEEGISVVNNANNAPSLSSSTSSASTITEVGRRNRLQDGSDEDEDMEKSIKTMSSLDGVSEIFQGSKSLNLGESASVLLSRSVRHQLQSEDGNEGEVEDESSISKDVHKKTALRKEYELKKDVSKSSMGNTLSNNDFNVSQRARRAQTADAHNPWSGLNKEQQKARKVEEALERAQFLLEKKKEDTVPSGINSPSLHYIHNEEEVVKVMHNDELVGDASSAEELTLQQPNADESTKHHKKTPSDACPSSPSQQKKKIKVGNNKDSLVQYETPPPLLLPKIPHPLSSHASPQAIRDRIHIYRDSLISNEDVDDLSKSLASTPIYELVQSKGAASVDELILTDSDLITSPIMTLVKQLPKYNPSAVSGFNFSAEDVVVMPDEERLAYIQRIIKTLKKCSKKGAKDSRAANHVLGYMLGVAQHSEVANLFANSSVLLLLTKEFKTFPDFTHERIAVTIGTILQHATLIGVDVNMTSILHSISDAIRLHWKNVKVLKQLLAALGEAVYFTVTQQIASEEALPQTWTIPPIVFKILFRGLGKEEEKNVQQIAAKTIENIATVDGEHTQHISRRDVALMLWRVLFYSNTAQLKRTCISAILHISYNSPSLFQHVIDKVGAPAIVDLFLDGNVRVCQAAISVCLLVFSEETPQVRAQNALMECDVTVNNIIKCMSRHKKKVALAKCTLLLGCILSANPTSFKPVIPNQTNLGGKKQCPLDSVVQHIDRTNTTITLEQEVEDEDKAYVVQCIGSFVCAVVNWVPFFLDLLLKTASPLCGRRHPTPAQTREVREYLDILGLINCLIKGEIIANSVASSSSPNSNQEESVDGDAGMGIGMEETSLHLSIKLLEFAANVVNGSANTAELGDDVGDILLNELTALCSVLISSAPHHILFDCFPNFLHTCGLFSCTPSVNSSNATASEGDQLVALTPTMNNISVSVLHLYKAYSERLKRFGNWSATMGLQRLSSQCKSKCLSILESALCADSNEENSRRGSRVGGNARRKSGKQRDQAGVNQQLLAEATDDELVLLFISPVVKFCDLAFARHEKTTASLSSYVLGDLWHLFPNSMSSFFRLGARLESDCVPVSKLYEELVQSYCVVEDATVPLQDGRKPLMISELAASLVRHSFLYFQQSVNPLSMSELECSALIDLGCDFAISTELINLSLGFTTCWDVVSDESREGFITDIVERHRFPSKLITCLQAALDVLENVDDFIGEDASIVFMQLEVATALLALLLSTVASAKLGRKGTIMKKFAPISFVLPRLRKAFKKYGNDLKAVIMEALHQQIVG